MTLQYIDVRNQHPKKMGGDIQVALFHWNHFLFFLYLSCHTLKIKKEGLSKLNLKIPKKVD